MVRRNGNHLETVTSEGIYSFRMVPHVDGGFDISGDNYRVDWEIRPQELSDIPRPIRLKMFNEAILAGQEFKRRYSVKSTVIYVSASDFSNLVRTVAE
ncbi:hypothetical protein FJZ21_01095 [Candidatus Pacearchaeota archaeon]|nr:hypothetical protein [Candidatus Pacearchaeota archaeon]